MSSLSHLIYASKAASDVTEKDVLEILSEARKKNKKIYVTGMLLFDSGSFFQVLEGDEKVLKKLFTAISEDKRHSDIVRIIFEGIPERKFSNWTMGYANLSRKDLCCIDGMNDFFDDRECLNRLDKGRAKKILTAFAKGRWRLN